MSWYNKLSNSEKQLLKYGAIMVATALFWAFIYQPMNKSIIYKQQQILQLTSQHDEMQASEGLLNKQKVDDAKYIRSNNKPFISWIDEQLDQQQLAQFVTRSEPKDNSSLIINFENVEFDKLAIWLQVLEQKYHINISEADINLTDRSNGLCNARLTLQE
ncbi:MAG: type II secretion system protein M [Proteobacteria bacterium]|nr:type II secretion system protein M [Pseudomonadota bacterium]